MSRNNGNYQRRDGEHIYVLGRLSGCFNKYSLDVSTRQGVLSSILQ